MKKVKQFSVIFIALVINSFAFSQNLSSEDKTRIADIKRMYKEANDASTLSCKDGSSIEFDALDPSAPQSEKFEFLQTAKYCNLTGGYKTLSGNLTGYEWWENLTFYFRENELFFVFINSGAEACEDEYRIYFDKNEQVIKILHKTNDCDPTASNLTSREITDISEQTAILEDLYANFDKLMNMFP